MPPLPSRASLLSTRLGELREWTLIVGCPCRGYPRYLPIAPLVEAYGSKVVLERLVMRLRCEKCRRGPKRVEARVGDPFAVRGAPVVVILESPGDVQRGRG